LGRIAAAINFGGSARLCGCFVDPERDSAG